MYVYGVCTYVGGGVTGRYAEARGGCQVYSSYQILFHYQSDNILTCDKLLQISKKLIIQ